MFHRLYIYFDEFECPSHYTLHYMCVLAFDMVLLSDGRLRFPRMEPEEGVTAAPMPIPPRLLIKKLVCENFKSYAGIKELGPFHKVINTHVHYYECQKDIFDSVRFA